MPNVPLPRPIVVTNRRAGGWPMVAVRALLLAPIVLVMVAGTGGFALYTHFARDLPRLDTFDEMVAAGVTRFEAADGELVGEWFEERRLAVTWGELPERLVLAFLAAEDARFFEHSGVDLRGVARAMLANLRAGTVREGASTITQQLAKILVGADKSYQRKAREAILARRMEDLYSKKQIFTWYLNVIYLGHGSYGVQAAARSYFRKNLWELSLAETAMIAGLAQAPGRVNPVVNPPAAKRRMAHVLRNMSQRGWITPEEEEAALAERLRVYPLRDLLGDHVPHYTEAVRLDVARRYGRGEGDGAEEAGRWLDRGLVVSLAVEPGLQRVAERSLGDTLEELAKKQGYPGPLARLEREVFFDRNAPFAATVRPVGPDGEAGELVVGARVLARVSEVSARRVAAEIGPGLSGAFTLADASWAAPYTVFPVDDRGRRRTAGRVSFMGKLKTLVGAFAEGDVVLVEVKGQAGDGALELSLVPVPLMEGALLSYSLDAGGVQAMVGGWDFDRSQVNRVHSVRQTGSTMKPIVYSKAYDLGLPPSALFSGAPFREGEYNPTGARTKDDMLVYDALTRSENSVSLRVLQYVLNHTSLADYQAWGRQLGLTRELTGYTSEVLGADQTLYGMSHAFALWARRGLAPDLYLIRRVTDREGRVLERHVGPLDPHAGLDDTLVGLWREVVSPPVRRLPEIPSWLTARNLIEAVRAGTGTRARGLGREAAGKTGTLAYDVWFIGFTADRLTGVWVGADRRERTLGPSESDNRVYGSNTALPAWLDFNLKVGLERPDRPVAGPPPEGVVEVRVDPYSGLLARERGRLIPHRRGTEPTEHTPRATDPVFIGEAETEF